MKRPIPMTLDFSEITDVVEEASTFLSEHAPHLPTEVLNRFAVEAKSLFSADELDTSTAVRAGEACLRFKIPHRFGNALAALRTSDGCSGVFVHTTTGVSKKLREGNQDGQPLSFV